MDLDEQRVAGRLARIDDDPGDDAIDGPADAAHR
jgi:hypothetical protein